MCNHDAVGSPDGMRRARQTVYGEAMIAVLFDFNGVLVDDEDVHFEAFRRILEVLGVTISPEVYRRYLGFDDRGTIVALLGHYGRGGDVDDGELGRLVARKQRSYARLAGQHPRLGFGARPLVLALRAAGARLAIVSGARRAEIDAVLDASSLRECFDAIVAAEDVTRGKPDPEGYRLARARLDAVAGTPLAAVAIEDAPAGLRAARDAGARCIGLATTCPAAELDGADAIVPSLGAIDVRRLMQLAASDPGAGAVPPLPVLFTPGPVRVPPAVTRALVDPPCNYHRQEGFRALRADIERDLVGLLGIRDPGAYQATVFTATGTGANEACLLALAGTGPGLVAANGFFAARLVEQAARNGITHRVLEAPPDRPLDPTEIDRALVAAPELRWLYLVSHETRAGLKNPLAEIGAVARRRGVAVAADVVSSAFAYPIDIEGAGLDLAVTSSSKAIGAVPGLGIVLVRAAFLERLRAARGAGYYLDLVAECDKQRRESQPRFAQPVALYAALAAACTHLRSVGVEAHMARMQRQMQAIVAHLEALGAPATLPAPHRSGVAVNFRLPAWLPYPAFARRMLQEGYYLLYGPPGDDGQFQVSTIGDLDDSHVAGLQAALTRVLTPPPTKA
jgi:HAD superfamily hydrolase (TIGR01509 family)